MACHTVRMWSLSGLVAAFLDLTIAYLLLCGSAVAYSASKLLGFFGLSLPCPCDGVFINVHSRSLCFNRLLVDFPIQKLSDVQLAVRQRFPFGNSASPKKYSCSMVGDDCGFGILELESEASCSSSISDARGSSDVVCRELSSMTGKIDMKGKGVLSHRPRTRLRHRKGFDSHGKNSSVFSYDPPVHEEVIDEQSYHHISTNKRGSWFIGDGSRPVDNAGNHNLGYDKAPEKVRARLRTLSRDNMNLLPDEDMHMKKNNTPSSDELLDNQQGIQGCDGDENSKVKLLEQALEKERASRAALCIDLEEERSAAASAADEAMAMILRLQEEKASIEMEARQYKRMIEEKSAYDDVEMNILEEILVRREKEKLYLEKEVEAYRQMVSGGNEQLSSDFSDDNDGKQILGPLNDPGDGPVLILNELGASTKKNVTMEDKCTDGVFEIKFNSRPDLVLESPFQRHDEQSNFGGLRNSNENFGNVSVCNSSGKFDLRKEIVPVDKDIQLLPKALLECEKSMLCHTKNLEQVQEMDQGPKLSKNVVRTYYGTEKGDPNVDPSLKQQPKYVPLGERNSCDPIIDKEPHVYDVHIIGDGINTCSEATEDKAKQIPFSSSLKACEADYVQPGGALENINVISDSPSACCLKTETVAKKSSPEVTSCLPPSGKRGSSHSLRQSSMSSMDSERLKIDTEIIHLQDRLKLVQEGRGKLGFSLEYRESKNSPLRILEDIAKKIQEIQSLTGPEKAARQASLPPPNSKVLSKKRRSRSVSSFGFQMSSEG